MSIDEDIAEQYTDYISENHSLFCWEFSPEELEQHYGSYYGLHVKSALLQGLKSLAMSRNKRLRDRRFTIWMGDYGPYYLLGVSSQLSSQVTRVLERLFVEVVGYKTSEFDDLSRLRLKPVFRYESGRVIEYSDESVVGTEKIDDDEWYGSGLTILHRMAAPVFGRKDVYRG
jgi:hypothetical protein